MINTIVFDINGVLIYEKRFFSARLQEIYGTDPEAFYLDQKPPLDIAMKSTSIPTHRLLKPVFKKWKLEFTEKELLDFWFAENYVTPKAVEFITKLKKRGLTIYALSNDFIERSKFYRTQYKDLMSLFDREFISCEIGLCKPEPEAFLHLIEKTGLNPKETLLIDDWDKCIATAKSLGFKTYQHTDFNKTRKHIDSLTKPKKRSQK